MRPRAGNLACHAGTFSTAAGNSCRGFVATASSRLRRLGPRRLVWQEWAPEPRATHARRPRADEPTLKPCVGFPT